MSDPTRRILLLASLLLCFDAVAAIPNFRSNTCPVRLNGIRLGHDLTSDGSSLRNSIVYDPASGLYHLWLLASNDSNFPASATLPSFTHATSSDGTHFTSTGPLSYLGGGAPCSGYGASIDPPLDFVRGAFDPASNAWKLFGWTENVGSSVGQYNYNVSANALGSSAGTTAVTHQGPLQSPSAGNNVGAFGLVDGKLYLRVDSGGYASDTGGGNGQFAYTDATPPATGSELGEADLFVGTPYCWLLSTSCGTTDPLIPAYVHNVGRTLRQADVSLVTYYTFRHSDGSRTDAQVWFVTSSDNGASWSAPAGVFAAPAALRIDGQPLASDGYFSSVEAAQEGRACRLYFSSKDAAGLSVMLSVSTGSACDALLVDSFDGCGD